MTTLTEQQTCSAGQIQPPSSKGKHEGFYLNELIDDQEICEDGTYDAQVFSVKPLRWVTRGGMTTLRSVRFAFDLFDDAGAYVGSTEASFKLTLEPNSSLRRAATAILGRELTQRERLGGLNTSQLENKMCRLRVAHLKRRLRGVRRSPRVLSVQPAQTTPLNQSEVSSHAE